MDRNHGCPLCEHKRITKHYYEDDKVWIADCTSCHVPMLVIKKHGYVPSPGERGELIKLCEKIFGKEVKLRGFMRSLSSHFHDHLIIG